MLKNYFLPADESAEYELFVQTINRFCDDEIEPHYAQWEKDGMVPRELYYKVANAGMMCVDVPEQYGGLGVSPRFSFAVIETMSRRGYLGFAGNLQTHNDINPFYLMHFGSEAQKQQWLPKLASGEIISAIAMTEPGAGSDVKNIRTSARRDGDSYVLNGSKIFISNGQHADLFIVAAKTDPGAGARGISQFLVDARLPGFTRGRKLDKIGQLCGDTSEIFFDDMRIPADALLGVEGNGFVQMMRELPRERLICAIQALGGAKAARDFAARYVQERQAFGAPLAQLQNTRFVLADVETEIAASDALVNHCIEAYLRNELKPETASAAKLQTSEMLGRVADATLQLFGGYGYMREYPISRVWADARVIRIYGGASEIMKELVARSVIGR